MPTSGNSKIFFGGKMMTLGVTLSMTISAAAAERGAVSLPAEPDKVEQAALPSGDSAAFRGKMLSWISESHPNSMIVERQIATADPGRLRISSPFGWRSDPLRGNVRHHAGVDLPGRMGTNVYATGAGQVVRAGWASGYGRLIEIKHADGVRTRFGHLSNILVRSGSLVRQGQLIGKVGSTGKSTGPHLHYEVRVDGMAVDPMEFIGQTSIQYETIWSVERPTAPRWTGWAGSEADKLPQSIIN